MIKRGNTLSQVNMFPIFSEIPELDLEVPQYESLPQRIERLKTQQRLRRQEQECLSKTQNHLEEYLLQTQASSVQSQLRLNRSMSPVIPTSPSASSLFPSKQSFKILRKSMDFSENFESQFAPMKNPEVEGQLMRSSSLYKISQGEEMRESFTRAKREEVGRRPSSPMGKPLVAGRIYCKQELVAPAREPTNRIRRIPIHNLLKR